MYNSKLKAMKTLKNEALKKGYVQPSTDVTLLQAEGFICQSNVAGTNPGDVSAPASFDGGFESIL